MFHNCSTIALGECYSGHRHVPESGDAGVAYHSSFSKTQSTALCFMFFFASVDVGLHLALAHRACCLQRVDCRASTLLWTCARVENGAVRGYRCPSFPGLLPLVQSQGLPLLFQRKQLLPVCWNLGSPICLQFSVCS